MHQIRPQSVKEGSLGATMVCVVVSISTYSVGKSMSSKRPQLKIIYMNKGLQQQYN
jgi:hypothetical protein